ncbi:hypothetical protein GQX73_g4758 [Xylaria multiplex]|uniref:Uncharacterized protein n=1 Tax=Xylaria multiplex TaxID=323545 RepID=A0A7C8MYM4_9PEZI|nr:hypothetical protein GQX73_g4758 [Xylaria multiplex]
MTSGYQPQGGAQSAQDQSTSPRADLIPLVCFICPKNSHFSDLSHLLTHISSKGHLHNMFQLTLSRDVDEAAELSLAEFESWYKQNNIGALLRARKTAREQRDNHQRRSQNSSSFGGDIALASRQDLHGGRSNRRTRGNGKLKARRRDEGMDELNGDIVKFESDDDEAGNKHEYHSATHSPYIWHSGSPYPNNTSQYANDPNCQFQDYLEDEDDSSKYEPSELYSPFPPEDTPDTIEDDTGTLILKGVVYPGMAGHGVHLDVDSLHDCNNELDDDEGSKIYHGLIGQCLMIPRQISEPMFTRPSQERYGDNSLALRPGNPNAAFASPTSNFKKSPPRYSGKENSHLLIKSPSSFNSYLQPSREPIEASNYNPLCPQPRDGFGYRLYSPYDEEPKSATSSSFNPINSGSNYDPTHMSNIMGNPYHRGQPGGEDYSL